MVHREYRVKLQSTSRLGRPSVGKIVVKQGITLLQRLGPSHGLQRYDQTRAQSGRALRVEVEDWLSNVMVTKSCRGQHRGLMITEHD